MRPIVGSVALFVLAGLCEIGGGYLVWQWSRSGASWILGVLGAAIPSADPDLPPAVRLVVANWGTGLAPGDLTVTLDRLYLDVPRRATTWW